MQKRVLAVLFGTLLLDMIGVGMIFPILPAIFTDSLSPYFMLQGYSVDMRYVMAGVLTALFSVVQFIVAPILGELSDVYGRKKLLTVGIAVFAISQLVFGFAIAVMSLPLLFISRAISGLGAANFSIAQAAIADVTPPQDRAKNFGLVGAAFGIGFILGPLLGGLISDFSASATAPFWVAGALGIVNLVFISLFLPETRKVSAEEKHHFDIWRGLHNIRSAVLDKDARPVYLTNFLSQAGFAFFTTFIGILLVVKFKFSPGMVGAFFAVVGIWVAITQAVILRIVLDRFRDRAILKWGLVMLALSSASYAFLPNVLWLYAVMPFVAIGQGLAIATITGLISKGVSEQKQGVALGINGSILALSNGVGPVLAGVGSGFLGISAPFVIGGFLIVLAWWVVVRMR
ncbi:MAG: MFS transporter [Candidatus Pacebacteria bacterium]|nr:MFS transporter [Candidatus Paceibacterota bacterium]